MCVYIGKMKLICYDVTENRKESIDVMKIVAYARVTMEKKNRK